MPVAMRRDRLGSGRMLSGSLASRLAVLGLLGSAFTLALACGARDTGEFDFVESGGSFGVGGDESGGSGGFSTGGSGGMLTGGSGGAFGTGGFDGAGGSFGFGGTGGFSTGGTGGFSTGGTGGFGGSFGFGGTGGVTTGGTGGAGGSPDAGIEICTNGIDDDFDNLVDCADPDCSPGFTCVPAVPRGWQGPTALFQATGDRLPTCPVGSSVQIAAAAGISAAPPDCASCLCGPAEGTVCQVSRLRFHAGPSCSGQSSTLTIASGVCQGFLLGTVNAASVSWDAANPAGGACVPGTDGSSTIPPVELDAQALACGSSELGSGCSGGVCAPRPPPRFRAGACIFRSGQQVCPAGSYSERFLYYDDVIDTRDCVDCACSSPSGARCTGSLTLATNLSCTADLITLNAPGVCSRLPPDTSPPEPPYLQSRSVFYDDGPPVGGSCSSSGGGPTGSAFLEDPITFCCEQGAGFAPPPAP